MYFIVIMAFALVLSDDLPPRPFSLFALPDGPGMPLPARSVWGTLALVAAQLAIVVGTAWIIRRRTLRNLAKQPNQVDTAAGVFSDGQRVLLGMIAAALVVTMVGTPWSPLVRDDWRLGRVPLVAELVILTPFFLSLIGVWAVFYRVEVALRTAVKRTPQPAIEDLMPQPPQTDAQRALAAAKHGPRHPTHSMGSYLLDKLRHQLLIIAVPMTVVVIARFFVDRHRDAIDHVLVVPWGADALLGCASAIVLLYAPVMLRSIWATESLPPGPLRDRLERMCRRVGLRYRDILLWHTHGMTVNAAVMGFVAPMRYVLISDALLETMQDEEIEAVFAHEAGHVQHWHLHYFVLFVLVTMYLSQGVNELLLRTGVAFKWGLVRYSHGELSSSILQMVGLGVLLLSWLFGFGWISRQFERQADLFGVRGVTDDISTCVAWCPIHRPKGQAATAGELAETISRSEPAASTSPYTAPGSALTGLPPPLAAATFVSVHSGTPAAATNLPRLCVSAAGLFGRTLLRIAELNGMPREAPSWRHGSIESRCLLIEKLATDPVALRRFDRRLYWIKVGLVLGVLIGTSVAAWLYWNELALALSRLRSR